jgi:dephospho-CoA kinase
MLLIGLTGGIGSGKTLVGKVFKSLGVPLYDADQNARLLMEQKPALIQEISGVFGSAVYREGRLDRKMLASRVFNDTEMLKKLNSVVHPYVLGDFTKWVRDLGATKYCIHEAAILYESGAAERFHRIVTVTAPEELRIERVMRRDGVSREEVMARMKNQLGEEQKNSMADYVITNDGDELLIPQVVSIHNELSALNN